MWLVVFCKNPRELNFTIENFNTFLLAPQYIVRVATNDHAPSLNGDHRLRAQKTGTRHSLKEALSVSFSFLQRSFSRVMMMVTSG